MGMARLERARAWAVDVLTSDRCARTAAAVLRDRIPSRGIVFDTSDPAFTPQTKALMLIRRYEHWEIRIVRRLLRGSDLVIELGSSLGIAASHIASVMAEGGRLVCVEARPDLLATLRSTLSAHAGGIEWEVHHAALAGRTGTASLALDADTRASHLAASGEGSVEVPALTFEDLLERAGIDRPYDLVCDIEGAERYLANAQPGTLAGCRRAVIELHDENGEPAIVEEVVDAFTSRHGFSLVAREGAVVGLVRD